MEFIDYNKDHYKEIQLAMLDYKTSNNIKLIKLNRFKEIENDVFQEFLKCIQQRLKLTYFQTCFWKWELNLLKAFEPWIK